MKTGSPAFGTPDFSTLGAQATGQMARRYGLPWRSSNLSERIHSRPTRRLRMNP